MREGRRVMAAVLGTLAVGLACAETATAQARRNYRGSQLPQQRLTTKVYDLELTVAPDAKVRIKNVPPRFDAKGQLLKYSADELKELRGDTPEDKKLPGYKRDLADLKVGDVVTVTLAQPQPDPRDKDKSHWVPAGQLTGTVAGVEGGKSLTLKVNSTEVKSPDAVPQLSGQNKVTVDPGKAQVALIMILAENTRDDPPPGAAKKKKDK